MGPIFSKSSSEDQNVETFSLLWLDASANITADNIKFQERLREVINQLKIYTNDEECQNDINRLTETNRIVFISSGSSGKQIVPLIHHLRQIFSIYIFCSNKPYHEQWSKEYKKVRGVFDRTPELVNQIIKDIEEEQYNKVDEQLSLSLFESEHFQQNSVSESDKHYIYSQSLIDCLLLLKTSSNEKNEFYSLCRNEYKSNKTVLNIISQFEQKYSSNPGVPWYINNSFLYKMLIKALRDQNFDRLFLLRFFLADIQQKIKENHLSSSICVYRSQLMSRDELHTLQHYRYKFLSINALLLAISERNSALEFFNRAIVTDEVEKVLFEIHADGTLDQIPPFMNIGLKCSNQKQILFSIGSIFRLDGIGFDADNVKIIKLTLCPKNHQELQPVFNYIDETYGNMKTSPLAFGTVLQKLRKYDEAQKYYQRLSQILPSTHYACSQAKHDIEIERENYERMRKDMEERENTFNPNSASAIEKNKQGDEFYQKRHYKRAIDCYQEGLDICREIYSPTHSEVGRCYKNLALAYHGANQYEEALEYYEKAKLIFQDHPVGRSELSVINTNIDQIRRYLNPTNQALIT